MLLKYLTSIYPFSYPTANNWPSFLQAKEYIPELNLDRVFLMDPLVVLYISTVRPSEKANKPRVLALDATYLMDYEHSFV